jgi:hypothetical protein
VASPAQTGVVKPNKKLKQTATITRSFLKNISLKENEIVFLIMNKEILYVKRQPVEV